MAISLIRLRGSPRSCAEISLDLWWWVKDSNLGRRSRRIYEMRANLPGSHANEIRSSGLTVNNFFDLSKKASVPCSYIGGRKLCAAYDWQRDLRPQSGGVTLNEKVGPMD